MQSPPFHVRYKDTQLFHWVTIESLFPYQKYFFGLHEKSIFHNERLSSLLRVFPCSRIARINKPIGEIVACHFTSFIFGYIHKSLKISLKVIERFFSISPFSFSIYSEKIIFLSITTKGGQRKKTLCNTKY